MSIFTNYNQLTYSRHSLPYMLESNDNGTQKNLCLHRHRWTRNIVHLLHTRPRLKIHPILSIHQQSKNKYNQPQPQWKPLQSLNNNPNNRLHHLRDQGHHPNHPQAEHHPHLYNVHGKHSVALVRTLIKIQ